MYLLTYIIKKPPRHFGTTLALIIIKSPLYRSVGFFDWSINLIEQGIQPKRTECIKLSAQRRIFCPAKKLTLN